MEWVETTGVTIEEARRHALDALGVPFDDAEIEVLEEAKSSMFGLRKSNARVRARVRPVQARAKAERRDRPRRKGGGDRSGRNDNRGAKKGDGSDRGGDRSGRNDNRGAKKGDGSNRGGRAGRDGGSTGKAATVAAADSRSSAPKSQSNDHKPAKTPKHGADAPQKEQAPMTDDNEEIMDAAGQAAVVEEFLDGLLEAFGADGDLESVALDEETYEVRAHGGELGLLIGPKGSTMQAVQDIARTAVQQVADGQLTGRVHIDIGGYRNKRRAALAEFATRLAESVRESGQPKVLEPMPPTDRKVIHDAVAELDGVISTSEGYDDQRHIVLAPSD
jgi:spoIIIJ-associated protein